MNKSVIIIFLFGVCLNVYAQDLIPFNSNGKWGFANSNGDLVIKATYDSVGVFNRDRLLRKKVSVVKKNGALNIINEQNVPLFDYSLKLKYIDLIESHIIVQREDGKFMAYDALNYKLDTKVFDSYDDLLGYTLSIQNNGKVGLIDYKLETIIPVEYDIIYFQWFYARGYATEEFISAIAENLETTVVNNELYVDGEIVDFNRDMMILTLINENESKRVLKYIDSLSDNEKFDETDDEEIEVDFATIESTRDIRKNEESIKLKRGYGEIDCDEDSGICVFSKDSKKGLYNTNTDEESDLYDYIDPNFKHTHFVVTNYGSDGYDSNLEGLIDANFETLLPCIYKNIRIDYTSDYIVYAKKEGDLYDYYNLKTKKYIFKDSEYKKGDYIYGGTSGGKYYFPIEKNGMFYYVDEDGMKYKN